VPVQYVVVQQQLNPKKTSRRPLHPKSQPAIDKLRSSKSISLSVGPCDVVMVERLRATLPPILAYYYFPFLHFPSDQFLLPNFDARLDQNLVRAHVRRLFCEQHGFFCFSGSWVLNLFENTSTTHRSLVPSNFESRQRSCHCILSLLNEIPNFRSSKNRDGVSLSSSIMGQILF
jgi:hypothetical protein